MSSSLVLIQDSPYLLRPAEAGDAAGVEAISAQIWGGHDYVPAVFDDWLADVTGEFTVVYDGERLAAFGKLTELGPGEWWWEGMRVDPAYRGRGLARALHNYAVGLFDRTGRGMLRFASNSPAVQKIAGDSGFRLVSRHLMVSAEVVDDGNGAGLVEVAAAELDVVRGRLAGSPIYEAAGGLVEDDWVWLEIAPRLEEWQAEGRLFWWQEQVGIVLVHLVEPGFVCLNYLDAPAEELAAVLVAVQGLAAGMAANRVEAKPLASPEMRGALVAAGWQIGDEEMWLYERPKR